MQAILNFKTLLQRINNDFRRYLHDEINLDQRMIGIKGARGAGKTTLLLQHLKYDLGDQSGKGLYVTADHTWFYSHTLLATAMEWCQQRNQTKSHLACVLLLRILEPAISIKSRRYSPYWLN